MQILKITLLIVLVAKIQLGFGNEKLSKYLQHEIKTHDSVEIYVILKNQNKIKPHSGSNRINKLKHNIQQLKVNANMSQSQVKPLVSSLTKDYKFYWINNSFWAKISSNKLNELIKSDQIEKVYSNRPQKLKLVEQKLNKSANQKIQLRAIEWNLSHINVPQVWNQGIKGEGVIIAGQDTGFQWDHKSIKNQYAGWNGTNVNHNYHWHDAITSPFVNCIDESLNPASCDDHGHGTHTMGTMVGDDSEGNQIGVAPSAKWIGCRNMNVGNGTPSTYTDCFQFFMEPTDINGLNPDASKAPHIINNSWACIIDEGCIEPTVLESIVNNVVDAGIFVIVSAGNNGPGCNTVNTPAAIYNKSLTIGSIRGTDEISSFSSQGAVSIDGSNRIKPDLVAPGSSIRSAELNGEYITFSGTSMASPHVAGVAALMISANPNMAGKPKILKHVILRTTHALTTQQSCNGILGNDRPNNTFGWGKIDALAAVNEIKDIIYLDNYEDF